MSFYLDLRLEEMNITIFQGRESMELDIAGVEPGLMAGFPNQRQQIEIPREQIGLNYDLLISLNRDGLRQEIKKEDSGMTFFIPFFMGKFIGLIPLTSSRDTDVQYTSWREYLTISFIGPEGEEVATFRSYSRFRERKIEMGPPSR